MQHLCRPPRGRPALALALALAALTLRPAPAAAQTYRWDDGGSATNRNWDNPANWFNITGGTNDGVPPTTSDVQFGLGYAAPIVVNLNGNRTVNSLAFGVPAATTLSGNTLQITSGALTVYDRQFGGTDATLPPTGSAVTALTTIGSALDLRANGTFDVRADLLTSGAIGTTLVTANVDVTKAGAGLWRIDNGTNTFARLNLQGGIVQFADVGGLGVNAGGSANQISLTNGRLLYTGNTPNQVLSKDIVFTTPTPGTSFETFNARGAVGPNAGSLTLAGRISGDMSGNGSNAFVIRALSPTDPNFAVVLSNSSNNYIGPTVLGGGTLRLTADNALGAAGGSVFNEFQFGDASTGSGPRTDATLQVTPGLFISEDITSSNLASPGAVYTIGTAPGFTSGTSTFGGTVTMGNNQGLTLAVNGGATLVFTRTLAGSGSDLIKTGDGTARLTDTSVFSGFTRVTGGTLHLTGVGSLSLTAGVTLQPGGTLLVDNSGSSISNTRVRDNVSFGLFGGTVSLVGAPGNSINEVIGNTSTANGVSFNAGASTVNVTTVGQSTTLTIAKFSRPAPTFDLGGTVNFTATGGALGQPGSNVRVLFNTAPTLTGDIIGGWATVNGSDWATYDATNGVQALAAYTPFASAGAADNALLNAAGATTAGPAAVNSLKIAPPDSASSLDLPAALTVATGGVLQTGGRPFTVASPLAAGAGTDLAVHTDAGSTLTLAGGVTAAGLNKSGPGTLVLSSNAALASGGASTSVNVNDGVLRLVGDDRLPANTIVMVNSSAAVGLDLNNTNQTIGNLQGMGNVAAGTGTLTLTGALARATPLTGTLSGSGALVKSSASGTSSTQLAGDNPFTGTITVTGGSLHLAGVNATAAAVSVGQVGQTAATLQLLGQGTLAAASSNPVAVNAGGTLALRNDLLNLTTSSATPTASNRADRVADGRPILVGGGTIAFTGHGHPWVAATETLGAVTFNPGGATVRNTAVSGSGASVLTFAGLTRNAGSAVNFTTTVGTLGAAGANPRVLVTSGLGAGFLPWATVNGTVFAFYNGDGATANANGVQALAAAAQTAFASAGAADHALLGGAGSLGAPRSVTSLQINSTGTGQSLDLGANNLAIASGGLLKTGTQDYGITGTGTLGQAGTELIVHVAGTAAPPAGPVLTVAAPIAANGLTKAGAGVLSLTANNNYAGPTTVAAGSLQVLNPIGSAGDSATGAGAVNTFVGTVLMGGNAAGTAGQISGPVSVGGALRPGTSAAPGILTVRNDVTFRPDRTGVFSALLGGNAAGTEYSQLRVIGGDVVLNGALLSASFSGTPNAPLTIIDVTGGTVSGLFTNPGGQSLDDGAVFATFNGVPWFIDYTPTSVVVAPVPEPAGLLAVGAAGALAVGWLRRRRARRAGHLS